MNKVVLIGRICNDIELRYTGNNTPVATFTIAVNRQFTNQEGEREADFINCVVWRKQAENLKNYMSKGSQIAVEGSIQTRSYDDANGNKRYITEIVANNIEFLESKKVNANERNETQEENKSQTNPYEEFGKELEYRQMEQDRMWEDDNGLPF